LNSQNILIFEFSHYRPFLAAQMGEGRTGRRSALARALECPPSHISQVLKEKSDLTLEQGEKACRFLQLSLPETRFFLDLLNHDRAGSNELRAIYRQSLDHSRRDHLSVSGRLDRRAEMSEDVKAKYYSSWIYLAVHLGVLIPELRDRGELAAYLGVEVGQVSEALEFLVKNGFVVQDKNGLSAGSFNLFLNKDSAHLNNHHLNWRAKAMTRVLARREEDVHYTSAFTASRSAILKIKQNILDMIEENLGLIGDAKDEEIYVFNADLFRL
jgi:uncharacterized protein (TIGR02147 family)